MSRVGLSYAQARLQARYGQRANEAQWQPLLATTGYRAFLEQARGTSLQRWIANISPISTLHEVEQRLRGEFRRHVEMVARWVPASLRPAVLWTRILIDLPVVDYLLRGEPLIGWMLDDEYLKPIAAADAPVRGAVLGQTVYAPLARTKSAVAGFSRRGLRVDFAGDAPLRERWLTEWQRCLNVAETGQHKQIERLVRSVFAHLDSLLARAGEAPMPARAAWALRQELERRFQRYFRAGFLESSAIFAYLILEALEFERLRGELVSRRIFAGGGAT